MSQPNLDPVTERAVEYLNQTAGRTHDEWLAAKSRFENTATLIRLRCKEQTLIEAAAALERGEHLKGEGDEQ